MSYDLEVVVVTGVEDKREVVASLDGKELEMVVNADIKEFERFFISLGNDRLNGYESAILKTYLAVKLGVVPSPKIPL